MNKLFLNRIENLISVIDLNLPKVFFDALGKSDLEHLYTFAYASVLLKHQKAGGWGQVFTIDIIRRTAGFGSPISNSLI